MALPFPLSTTIHKVPDMPSEAAHRLACQSPPFAAMRPVLPKYVLGRLGIRHEMQATRVDNFVSALGDVIELVSSELSIFLLDSWVGRRIV